MKYNATLGFYEPSVFHLFVRGEGILKDINSWSEEQKSTFLHEFVHFLQDVTSVQGLSNMYRLGEYLRYVSEIYKSSPDHVLKLPIDPTKAKSNVDQNWIADEKTFGDPDYSILKVLKYDKVHAVDLYDCITGKTTKVDKVVLHCIDYSHTPKDIDFGTIHIMEGMAKYIQNCIYPPRVHRSPYNPYYIALDVAEKIIKGISSKPLTMVALFDYSLQSSNPGLAFVNYLEWKHTQGYDSTTLTKDIIYADLKSATTMHAIHGEIRLRESYTELSKMAEGVISEMLGNVWFYKNIDIWYQSVIQRARKIRFDIPEFFSLLVLGKDIVSNDLFKLLIDVLGTPIITNSNHKYDFKAPKNVPVTLGELMNVYAMMQLPWVFMSDGVFTCPLRKYCQQQRCGIKKQFVDKRCVKAPWLRMRKWNRCLFNQWLYFKGFKDVRFVR